MPMYRCIANTVSIMVLLVTFSLAAATPTYAQGAQHNETDIAFAKRMGARLERVEKTSRERAGETHRPAALGKQY